MRADLGDLMTSYDLFANKDEEEVDYLIVVSLVVVLRISLKQRQIN